MEDYDVFELVQFLTSSITFMVHLANVKVFWRNPDSESEKELLVACITKTQTKETVDNFTSKSNNAVVISPKGIMRVNTSSIERKSK